MNNVKGPGGKEIELSTNKLSEQRKHFEAKERELKDEIETTQKLLSECQRDLYEVYIRELHVKEIYRLASMHFPRLRREENGGLTVKDILEIEKWIGRAKSSDGLKNIVDALEELKKYKPIDIKSNIYALTQRIIIEGPYKEGPKKK